ncbi:hypothetical protein GPALN_013222 [Globodera pallida]|nr:hypothetical protein GPALN_013222 [Globodera pallida]
MPEYAFIFFLLHPFLSLFCPPLGKKQRGSVCVPASPLGKFRPSGTRQLIRSPAGGLFCQPLFPGGIGHNRRKCLQASSARLDQPMPPKFYCPFTRYFAYDCACSYPKHKRMVIAFTPTTLIGLLSDAGPPWRVIVQTSWLGLVPALTDGQRESNFG